MAAWRRRDTRAHMLVSQHLPLPRSLRAPARPRSPFGALLWLRCSCARGCAVRAGCCGGGRGAGGAAAAAPVPARAAALPLRGRRGSRRAVPLLLRRLRRLRRAEAEQVQALLRFAGRKIIVRKQRARLGVRVIAVTVAAQRQRPRACAAAGGRSRAARAPRRRGTARRGLRLGRRHGDLALAAVHRLRGDDDVIGPVGAASPGRLLGRGAHDGGIDVSREALEQLWRCLGIP